MGGLKILLEKGGKPKWQGGIGWGCLEMGGWHVILRFLWIFLMMQHRKNLHKTEHQNDGVTLKQKEFAKYLGILIDNKLTWSHHINQIKLKVSEGIAIQSNMDKTTTLGPLKSVRQKQLIKHLIKAPS